MLKKHKIRKKILILATSALAFAAVIFTTPNTVYADSQDMNYDETYNAMVGSFTTSEQITRIEVFYPSGYGNSEIYFSENKNVVQSESFKYLNEIPQGADVTISNDVEIIGGGTVELAEYGITCSSYYFVQKNDVSTSWSLKAIRTDSLGECFVVKAEVPSDWKNAAPSVTEPVELLCGFIDPTISSHTTDDIVPIISADVQEAESQTEFEELPPVEEKAKDPLGAILKAMIFLVVIAIVVTYILYIQSKRKHSKETSERKVKRANEKHKEQQKRDDDMILEIMDTYTQEYKDFDDKMSCNSNYADDEEDIDDDIYDDYDTDSSESVQIQPASPVELPEETVSRSTDNAEDISFDEPEAPVRKPAEKRPAEYENVKAERKNKKPETKIKANGTYGNELKAKKRERAEQTVQHVQRKEVSKPQEAAKPNRAPKKDTAKVTKTPAFVETNSGSKKSPETLQPRKKKVPLFAEV